MHFLNKLSTAALMRLTILASLDLLLYRSLGGQEFVSQPFVFLNLVTFNLGLYAVMVYSGTLNKTLIGMMVGGLIATLTLFAYPGIDPEGRTRFFRLGRFLVESLVDPAAGAPPSSTSPPPIVRPGRSSIRVRPAAPLALPPSRKLASDTLVQIGHLTINWLGLIVIAIGGVSARILQNRSRYPETSAAPLPLDGDAASPL